MGSACSFCKEEKVYFIAVLGIDKRFKREVFDKLTGSKPHSGEVLRYDERRVRIKGVKTVVCCLDDDEMTQDLWSVHVNCANGCLFICNSDTDDENLVEKIFISQFEKKLAKPNFSILVLIKSSEKINKTLLSSYSGLNNVLLQRVIEDESRNKSIEKGIDWLMQRIVSS